MTEQKPDETPQEEFHPRGTMVILGIFMLTLIVLWVSVYIILLQRGVTI